MLTLSWALPSLPLSVEYLSRTESFSIAPDVPDPSQAQAVGSAAPSHTGQAELGYIKFEVLVKHPGGGVGRAAGHTGVEFRRSRWVM